MTMYRERIIVAEDGADLLRDLVVREPAPSTELAFAGTGPGRGEWERAREVEVGYLPPRARAAAKGAANPAPETTEPIADPDAVGAKCYDCGGPADDQCPLCHRWVCRGCAEREGAFCCDG